MDAETFSTHAAALALAPVVDRPRAADRVRRGLICLAGCILSLAALGAGTAYGQDSAEWSAIAGPSPFLGRGSGAYPDARPLVACPDTGKCLVVGGRKGADGKTSIVIWKQSPAGWAEQTAPVPSTNATIALGALSCVDVNNCAVVGQVDYQPLLLTEIDGAWNASTALPPNAASFPGAFLSDVDCPAKRRCVAVGGYQTAQPSDVTVSTVRQGMIAVQTDAGWTATQAPWPPGVSEAGYSGGSNAELEVECPAVQRCIATRQFISDQYGSVYRILALRQTSDGWATEVPPFPSDVPSGSDMWPGHVGSLACTGVDRCVLVGETQGDNTRGLILTRDEQGWTATTPPGVESQDLVLTAVDCPAEGACVAAGEEYRVGDNPAIVISQEPDGSWASQEVGMDLYYPPTGIACAAKDACAFVTQGRADTSGTQKGAMIGFQVDGTWIAENAPLPAGLVAPAVLAGIDCDPGGGCVATGSAASPANQYSDNGFLVSRGLGTAPVSQPVEPDPVGAVAGEVGAGVGAIVDGDRTLGDVLRAGITPASGFMKASSCDPRGDTRALKVLVVTLRCIATGGVFVDPALVKARCVLKLGSDILPVGKLKALKPAAKRLDRLLRLLASELKRTRIRSFDRALLRELDEIPDFVRAARDPFEIFTFALLSDRTFAAIRRTLTTGRGRYPKALKRLSDVRSFTADVLVTVSGIRDVEDCLLKRRLSFARRVG